MTAVTMDMTGPWIPRLLICEAHELHDHESKAAVKNPMNSNKKIVISMNLNTGNIRKGPKPPPLFLAGISSRPAKSRPS